MEINFSMQPLEPWLKKVEKLILEAQKLGFAVSMPDLNPEFDTNQIFADHIQIKIVRWDVKLNLRTPREDS